MADIVDIPVVVVGGGGCGLSLSAFLSDYGIAHCLFERHSGTSVLPKAHYLNQRTMETFRLHSMIDGLKAVTCPLRHMSQVAWATTLGGDDAVDRQVIHKYSCFGGEDGTTRAQTYERDAPLRSFNLPQIRMEPILRDAASTKNPGRVLFGHSVEDFDDCGDHLLVTVRDQDGRPSRYRAQYLVGADAGKLVGPKIGVQMEGPTGICDMVSMHFEGDLCQYWDDRLFACHLVNGSCGTIFESGAIVPMGPTWGKHSEEWVFHLGFDLADADRFNEEKLISRMRELFKIPDLKIRVRKVSHWIVERVLANKYRQGRVFIAGDAAHRRPPTTGLGLNTSIEDALNLAWKLAMVVQGKASPKLLDTYEMERRPVGERNCDWGLFTFQNSTVINAALGLSPGKREANQRRFELLFEDSERGATLRAQVRYMIESQKIEFSAHDLELGFKYERGCLLHDGSDAPPVDPLGQEYIPCTRPGHRLPHAWLERGDEVISSHDLVRGLVEWALITDKDGQEWIAAADRASTAHGIKINTAQVGAPPLLRDYDDQWEKVNRIGRGGAILVRPDNIVAWRSKQPSLNSGAELEQAVNMLLSADCGLVESRQMQNGI